MKKVIFILLSMVFTLARADTITTFPSFPMIVWGNINIDSKAASPGTVLDFYDGSGNLLYHQVIIRSGVYGGFNPSADISPTLNEFSGALTIKITTQNGAFNVAKADFSSISPGEGCPVSSRITFTPLACRYDISIKTVSDNTPSDTNFSDINDSFARDNIIIFEKKGLVKGFSDNTFRPNHPITRAEFLALAMNSAVTDVDKTIISSKFSDIPSDGSWMIPYAEAGRKFGIAGQFKDGKNIFRPNEPITRAEALAMLFRIEEIQTSSVTSTTFTDISSMWQIAYVQKASELSIISGQNISGKKVFRPNEPITRAEAITIIIKASGLK